MVRVRFYQLTLSLPFILVVGSLVMAFVLDSGFKAVFFALGSGVALQLIFALVLACPKCGKSPYAIGPSIGPFALAGKPVPDIKCTRCGFDFLKKMAEGNAISETPPPK